MNTLDKLTQRASLVLKLLPANKRASVEKIISSIREVTGLGAFLSQFLKSELPLKVKTVDVNTLVKEAYYQALKFEHPYVGTEHLLLALLKIVKSTDYERVRTELSKINIFPINLRLLDATKKTPILESFSENLNQMALKEFDRVIVPRLEYKSLVSSLLLKESTGVLLIGEQGVGRKTLIDYLARSIISLDIPPYFAGYQIIEFDLMGFMSSIFTKGGVELGLSALIDELKTLGRVVLSIKNFENLFLTTSAGLTVPMFYSMFKSAVENLGIKMIGVMDISLYEKVTSDNEHILDNFTVIELEEPTEPETIKILDAASYYIGKFHNVTIPQDVMKYVYKKSKEELPGSFPRKGIDLLDHACTHIISNKSRIPSGYKKLVDKSFEYLSQIDDSLNAGKYDDASRVRNKLKGLDKDLMLEEEKIFFGEKILILSKKDIDKTLTEFNSNPRNDKKKPANLAVLSSLSAQIKKRIIGQDVAVDSVVKSLIRSKLGLRTRKRPLGNFLLLGPTGIGKTELAKVLADVFFGNNSLIRLDMSDFAEKHNVARLVGAPPGYVGYGEGGELTTKIAAKPNSVVLFDEIEKAHPDVLNILLQIMEEGELKDAKGQTFDFSSAVIILTSNLGTEILHLKNIGFGDDSISEHQVSERLKNNAKKILKPELINRFDEIIIFSRLSQESQYKVLDLLINEVLTTLKNQKIKLTLDPTVRDFLLKEGYSQEYGARALRRTLETKLLDKIAEYLLENRQRPLQLKAIVQDNNIEIR